MRLTIRKPRLHYNLPRSPLYIILYNKAWEYGVLTDAGTVSAGFVTRTAVSGLIFRDVQQPALLRTGV